MRATIIALTLLTVVAPCAVAQDHNAEVEELLKEFTWPGAVRLPIGVTAKGTLIWCVMDREALWMGRPGACALFVASVDGDAPRKDGLLTQLKDFALKSRYRHSGMAIAIVPIANPDGWFGGAGAGLKFPPTGEAYHAAGQVEAHVLWRFVKWLAPDVVYEVLADDDPVLQQALKAGTAEWPVASLAAALESESVSQGFALVRSHRVPASLIGIDDVKDVDPRVLRYAHPDRNGKLANPPHSLLHQVAAARLKRSPTSVADELSRHYGNHLKTVMYQPALALVGRMRLGDLANDPTHQAAVGKVLAAHLEGSKDASSKAPNGSEIAGHLVFADWALRTGDERAVLLVKRAADQAFHADGSPREAMPSHNEMSDAVFMGCPILTAAGRLTGDPKYLDMAATHLAFMRKLCLRDDGIYRHSPLCETAWGRGNGFPALGLALCLTDLDAIVQDDKATAALKGAAARVREQMLPAYRAHMAALLPHQDLTGTWRQVIDHPGAYRELTATCMITFAMARGLRQGWLDGETYRPVVDRAWEGIKVRVGSDGTLFDVCTGTGKQKTLQDYLDRTAILGKDERGGAMALLAAVEMAALQAESRP